MLVTGFSGGTYGAGFSFAFPLAREVALRNDPNPLLKDVLGGVVAVVVGLDLVDFFRNVLEVPVRCCEEVSLNESLLCFAFLSRRAPTVSLCWSVQLRSAENISKNYRGLKR